MHTLTRIRAAGYSTILATAGTLSVPLRAYAQGDAAAGEKIFFFTSGFGASAGASGGRSNENLRTKVRIFFAFAHLRTPARISAKVIF
jgi:hypothetical protein